MANPPHLLRARIQSAIEQSPLDATTVARMLKRGPDYIRDFLNERKHSLKATELVQLESILSVSKGFFVNAHDSEVHYVDLEGINKYKDNPPALLSDNSIRYLAMPKSDKESDSAFNLPVYASVEGGAGVMVVSTDPIDIVARPWFMREVKDGFAVLVVGESMEPAFEAGDMAIVNPRLPPIRNKTAIFVSGTDGGEFKASIKRLIRWDDDTWHVRQYNAPLDFKLSRREWPKALRVVGKIEG